MILYTTWLKSKCSTKCIKFYPPKKLFKSCKRIICQTNLYSVCICLFSDSASLWVGQLGVVSGMTTSFSSKLKQEAFQHKNFLKNNYLTLMLVVLNMEVNLIIFTLLWNRYAQQGAFKTSSIIWTSLLWRVIMVFSFSTNHIQPISQLVLFIIC